MLSESHLTVITIPSALLISMKKLRNLVRIILFKKDKAGLILKTGMIFGEVSSFEKRQKINLYELEN